MAGLQDFRQKTGGAYDDMSDQQLADALYTKHYSDMPREQFNQKMGLVPEKPEYQAEAGSAGGAALRGVPVLGAYVPKAEAAIRAAMQPVTGVGEPGASWSERYAANVPKREAAAQEYDTERPVASTALKVAGGAAALAPIGATAAGARAMGMAGPWATRPIMGAASGGGIAAADAAAHGEDVGGNFKAGVGIGAAAPFVGAGLQRLVRPGATAKGGTAPLSGDKIEAQGVATYDATRDAARGTPLGGGSKVGEYISDKIADAMETAKAPRTKVAPSTWSEIKDIANAKDVGDLVESRQAIGKILREGSDSDVKAAAVARNILDAEIDRFLPGTSKRLGDADKNYAIAKEVADFEGHVKLAKELAESRHRARQGTQLRNTALPYLKPDAKNVSPEVRGAAQNLFRNGPGAQTAQMLSLGDPSRGILNWATLPFSLSNPITGAVHGTSMALGYPAGKIFDAMKRSKVRALSEAIRREAPASLGQPGYVAPTMSAPPQAGRLSLGMLPYEMQQD